jgi:glycosyltransferase involved in cell wall biosynthesis
MCALIATAIYNTLENERYKETVNFVQSLEETVDWRYNRLFFVINGPVDEFTEEIIKDLSVKRTKIARATTVTYLHKNLGTAKAINLALRHRKPGEVCIKIDNDVVINDNNWPQLLEEVFERDIHKVFGICGLKRKDLMENPNRTDWFKSDLVMLPHEPGQRWVIVEKANHVMGTCQAYRPELLDKVGYLTQMGSLYGFDDSLMAIRCMVAGFQSCFLPWVDIDHLDFSPGTGYNDWKQKTASDYMGKYNTYKDMYISGRLSIKCSIDGEPL